MPRLSDIIEEFIKQLIEKKDGEVEIQRNELANFFNCAPSQINYVLSTRFTIERGYYIESKRGGGGSIRIVKVKFENSSNLLENILNNINSPVSQHQANEIVECLLENGAISKREASIMKAALNDKTLPVNQPLKDTLRMLILKAMIISLMNG
ncbi:transcriptional repressor, CtsR [Caldicellulosiruptor obsidiansis OB47]|uniref:Transcriptional regulator CtsR n=1 Tax=Caldicellulosiruptor obsidiansis (strain ATCC BAA-2073 / JCM 16842 / OB47) TaxID=608506 RepID=D9TFF3_CALOO|nr:CtsR family transcriptional regulator [Caldicellulosiruptor obsidiansis]ADL42923.1 transcriptional repressor, CtsR [Caldicellulosiruptor obsidiansis OB47]